MHNAMRKLKKSIVKKLDNTDTLMVKRFWRKGGGERRKDVKARKS